MRIPALVLAGVVTTGALTVSMQAQQKPAAPVNPSDVKGMLFELANSMGMLRGMQQEDSILTLEHWLKGTMTVGQQRFDVPEYRMSINYAVPGLRLDFRRQAAGGQAAAADRSRLRRRGLERGRPRQECDGGARPRQGTPRVPLDHADGHRQGGPRRRCQDDNEGRRHDDGPLVPVAGACG